MSLGSTNEVYATSCDESATSVAQQSLAHPLGVTSTAPQTFLDSMIRSNNSTITANAETRVFALIVAIDKYKSDELADLTGCKNDGKRFNGYLTGVLGVPSSRIVFLTDEYATREAILRNFWEHFIENADIVKGDTMVFFYAGHGSRQMAPVDWVSEANMIETICPHDARALDADEEWIQDIPDLTIDALMRRLAFIKGDNIIAIFDCCHSGGASRSEEASSLRVRSAPASPHPLPPDLDREIWEFAPDTSSRGTKSVIPTGSYKTMESHILLAACRPDESALEDRAKAGGLFTAALLKALRQCSLHETTYSQLFEKLNLRLPSKQSDKQHPQCLGANKDRLLFSVNTTRNGKTTFKVSQRGEDLYVSAGNIHGVVVGTTLTVTSGAQIVTLKTVKVDAFECLLERGQPPNFPASAASAVVSNWNHPKLRIHSPIPHASNHFAVVAVTEPADVAICPKSNGSSWDLERRDPLILKYSNHVINVERHPKRMDEVMELIAKFNSFLYRPDRAGGTFAGDIKVRVNRVERKGGEVNPTGDDLLVDVPDSLTGMGVREAAVTITDINCEDEYCVTLENYTEVDLYPYLFYFDPADYSIQPWYLPPSPTMLPPFKSRKEDGTPSLFAYGYGGFGTDPFQFFLPDGKASDSAFLKIFLTNTYVEMRNVAQASIYDRSLNLPGQLGRSQNIAREGIWECRTFVLTCKAP